MPEMTHSGKVEVVNSNAAPVSIELTRGQKGGIGFTVKVHSSNPETAIAEINKTIQLLKVEIAKGTYDDDKEESSE